MCIIYYSTIRITDGRYVDILSTIYQLCIRCHRIVVMNRPVIYRTPEVNRSFNSLRVCNDCSDDYDLNYDNDCSSQQSNILSKIETIMTNQTNYFDFLPKDM